MPADPEQRQSQPANTRRSRLLWCIHCGRTEARSPDDMLLYARHGWPECCGRVMSYFALPPAPFDPADRSPGGRVAP